MGSRGFSAEDLFRQVYKRERTYPLTVFRRGPSFVDGWAARGPLHCAYRRDASAAGHLARLMRKLLVALITLLIVVGVAVFVALRFWHKPIPTPVGWKAHVITLAGDGSPLSLSDPFAVAVGIDGTVYVADAGESNRIQKIALDGTISTLAGGSEGFSDGVGAEASFNTPSGLALSSDGNLFVADTGNNRIRKITPEGQVSTVAGDGTAGYADGPAAQAQFNGPIGVAVDASGKIYVAD